MKKEYEGWHVDGPEGTEDIILDIILWVGMPALMMTRNKRSKTIRLLSLVLTVTVFLPLIAVAVILTFFVLFPYLLLICRSDQGDIY